MLTVATLGLLISSLAIESAGGSAGVILLVNLLSYLTGGFFGIADAIPALRQRRLDINFLMVVAAIGAALIDQWHEGATLLFLFSLSNTLQSYAMERSRNAIAKLLKLRPSHATVLRDGRECRTPIEALRPGDRVLIRPGETVPTDGRVVHGSSDVNQASITGESTPVDKSVGDEVLGGTLNGSGALEVEVVKAARDSTLARIITLVETAQTQKSRTQRLFDRFENAYAMFVVVAAAAAVLVPWLLLGEAFATSFYRGMVLLVVASPCALIISTPASVLSAIANGALHGVLFKGGVHLENLAEVRVVAFDKTGTLTAATLEVTDVEPFADGPPESSPDALLAIAAALESRSEHPIARAVLRAARQRGLRLPELSEFRALPGRGIHARADGFLVWIGGQRLYEEHGEVIPARLVHRKAELERDGKTVLVVHREVERNGDVGTHEAHGGWLGLIAIADRPRPEAAAIVRGLRSVGIRHVAMLTGDNATVASGVARQMGVDEYFADLLPEQKVDAIRRLRAAHGPVLMVGDGINDAPALAAADVGAAMGAAGSDVALETADLVLMADDLANVPYALRLSRQARRIVWQNISFALGVIVVLVAGVFGAGVLGAKLTLPLGVVGHEGSTLIVVANGLRLLFMRR
ncbi:MAG: Zinc-transporting ATPase [Phycisphaerae bacterium]|nr:Zinc-transporting ATPase [Phycisphaerae bacterium]